MSNGYGFELLCMSVTYEARIGDGLLMRISHRNFGTSLARSALIPTVAGFGNCLALPHLFHHLSPAAGSQFCTRFQSQNATAHLARDGMFFRNWRELR